MIKCHFIEVLKTFNPEELRDFRDFLDSPYFNKRKKLLELFDVIIDYYPFFTDENFARENIFSKIYPEEEYNYGKINEGLSALYKLSLSYLRQISFEANDVYSDVTFLEGIRKRSLKGIFNLYSKDIDFKLNQFTNIDSNLFLKQYLVQIEKINYSFVFEKNNKKEKIESFIADISKMLVSLCNFYIAEVISICVNKFTYSRAFANNKDDVFEKIHHSDLIPKLFAIIKPFNEYDSYLGLLNCFFEAIYDLKDEKKYYHYKQMVFENISKMSVDDIGYHMSCLKSYCVIKKKDISRGEEFSMEYLNLQEAILENKLFVNSKSEFFFKEQYMNMLINYDNLKNKSKMKNLLNYVKYLPPDDREDMKNITEAHYNFLNYSYEKVVSSLKKINAQNKTFEEQINNLQIRTLYETGDYVSCFEKISLYKKQHRANKFLSKKRIESEVLFLSTLEKLIKVKEKRSDFDAEYLKNKIEKDEFIPSKEWLIEKCYELYDKPKQLYKY